MADGVATCCRRDSRSGSFSVNRFEKAIAFQHKYNNLQF